ncbi:hypothetical protein TNCV_4444631 [Trichonephila clavipes]|nr:hypothetical protein TNCV_4444631 [Trichonephila clavipes]
MGGDRQGRQKNKSSMELRPTGAAEGQEIKGAETNRGGKRTKDHRRMIRREMVRERYKGSKSTQEKRLGAVAKASSEETGFLREPL